MSLALVKDSTIQIDENTLDITHAICKNGDRLPLYVHPTSSLVRTQALDKPVEIIPKATGNKDWYVISKYICIPTNIEYADMIHRNWRLRDSYKHPQTLISNTKPRSAIRWNYHWVNNAYITYKLDYKTTQTLNKCKTIVS